MGGKNGAAVRLLLLSHWSPTPVFWPMRAVPRFLICAPSCEMYFSNIVFDVSSYYETGSFFWFCLSIDSTCLLREQIVPMMVVAWRPFQDFLTNFPNMLLTSMSASEIICKTIIFDSSNSHLPKYGGTEVVLRKANGAYHPSPLHGHRFHGYRGFQTFLSTTDFTDINWN